MSFFSTDRGIFYLHPYYPKKYLEHKGISQSIIEFKKGSQSQINKFTQEMKEALLERVGNEASKLKGICLVVMPSHSAEKWNYALLQMAGKLCEELNMLGYLYALKREVEHDKLSIGGDRSFISHINTIRLNSGYDVKGKQIVVLDDITTTGNSLLASAQILLNAGAKRVRAIAIGKTIEGTCPYEF